MPNTVTLISPPGGPSIIHGLGASVTPGPDGSVIVQASQVLPLLQAGFRYFRLANDECVVQAPAAADLVSIVAAVLPANGALTIAAQPGVPRKLQIRFVDDATHHITAGTITLVGVDGRGNAVTETISLISAVSVTLKSANAYATLTSATLAGLVFAGGSAGTDTIGIGVAADLALPVPQTAVDLLVYKESVAATGSAAYANEAVGTVDAVANTVSPTTAPDGAKCFKFWFNVGLAD